MARDKLIGFTMEESEVKELDEVIKEEIKKTGKPYSRSKYVYEIIKNHIKRKQK